MPDIEDIPAGCVDSVICLASGNIPASCTHNECAQIHAAFAACCANSDSI